MNSVVLKLVNKVWIIEMQSESGIYKETKIPVNGSTDGLYAREEAKIWAKVHRPCVYTEFNDKNVVEEVTYEI